MQDFKKGSEENENLKFLSIDLSIAECLISNNYMYDIHINKLTFSRWLKIHCLTVPPARSTSLIHQYRIALARSIPRRRLLT